MTDLFGDQLPDLITVIKPTIMREEISAEDLGLHLVNGHRYRDRIVSDSRKFAKVFHKHHFIVLRDIDEMLKKINTNLYTSSASSWFQRATFLDSYGREQPCYDLTRDGALTLGMSYDSVIAALVLIAFNKLEDALGEEGSTHTQSMVDQVNTMMQQVDARIENQFARLWGLFESLFEAVGWCQAKLGRRRIDISTDDMRTHREVVCKFFNGSCPCCQQCQILDATGEILVGESGRALADYDHAKQSAIADVHHTWLVCSGYKNSCHYRLTHGPTAIEFRLDSDLHWGNYQKRIIQYFSDLEGQNDLFRQRR